LSLSSFRAAAGEGFSVGEGLGFASWAYNANAEEIQRARRVIRKLFMIVRWSLNAKTTGCNPFLAVGTCRG
jgi:hypothetical protein